MANPKGEFRGDPVATSPKGFGLDRTMLFEIYKMISGLSLLVEVARENHRALYGPGATVDADPPDRTGSPSETP
ncbi:MAG: hypothetical protein ABSB61_06525 [Anaerolineales bacterium]|jgi:hypothetical protein